MLAPNDPRHGTQNGYGNLKCRCDACVAAHADYQQRPDIVRQRKKYGDVRLAAYRWVKANRPDVLADLRRGHAQEADGSTDG